MQLRIADTFTLFPAHLAPFFSEFPLTSAAGSGP
jgi:hypothetical protein